MAILKLIENPGSGKLLNSVVMGEVLFSEVQNLTYILFLIEKVTLSRMLWT